MKTCFILNPVAGKGRAIAAMEKAEAVFKAAGEEYEILRTNAIGHATELAANAVKDGFGLVVAVGGDGTVCEVAHGIFGSDAVLGIIPSGTGNDYCRCLGIPRSVTDAAGVLLSGKPRLVDCMRVDEFIGLNISTVGFDSVVVRNAEKFSWLRGMSYLASVLYTLPRYTPPEVTVTVDDGETVYEGTRYLVAAGCGTHYGGGMNVLPNSDPTDGLLDMLMVNEMKLPWDVFTVLPKYVKGKHRDGGKFTMRRAKKVVIDCEKPLTLNVDGNLYDGRHHVEMEIIPGSFLVMSVQRHT